MSDSKGQHEPLNAACPERPLDPQDRPLDCAVCQALVRKTASACPDRLVLTVDSTSEEDVTHGHCDRSFACSDLIAINRGSTAS